MADPRLVTQYELFSDLVQTNLGEHPARSILTELTYSVPGGGESVLIDSILPKDSDDAATMATSAKNTREDYYNQNASNYTWDNYKATLTPFNAVVAQRTVSKPNLIEAGSYFREDNFLQIQDPRAREIETLTRKIFKADDRLVAQAILAPTVDRYLQATPDTISQVALPASQALNDMEYGDINVDTLPSAIKEKMDESWLAAGEPVYCVISPKTARMLRQDNTVHSADFVRNYADLYRTGGLPEIDGVTFIVMPASFLAPFVGSGAVDTFFAWTPSAIASVLYSPFKVTTGVSLDHRADVVAYLRKSVDYKRTDDLGVVVGDIITT